MSSTTEAQLAYFLHSRPDRKAECGLAVAVRDAVNRLRDHNWIGGHCINDNDDQPVVIWTNDDPPVQMSFAFDAEMQPYWWASRAGADRMGRWCRSRWGQYRADEEILQESARWAKSLAR